MPFGNMWEHHNALLMMTAAMPPKKRAPNQSNNLQLRYVCRPQTSLFLQLHCTTAHHWMNLFHSSGSQQREKGAELRKGQLSLPPKLKDITVPILPPSLSLLCVGTISDKSTHTHCLYAANTVLHTAEWPQIWDLCCVEEGEIWRGSLSRYLHLLHPEIIFADLAGQLFTLNLDESILWVAKPISVLFTVNRDYNPKHMMISPT